MDIQASLGQWANLLACRSRVCCNTMVSLLANGPLGHWGHCLIIKPPPLPGRLLVNVCNCSAGNIIQGPCIPRMQAMPCPKLLHASSWCTITNPDQCPAMPKSVHFDTDLLPVPDTVSGQPRFCMCWLSQTGLRTPLTGARQQRGNDAGRLTIVSLTGRGALVYEDCLQVIDLVPRHA